MKISPVENFRGHRLLKHNPLMSVFPIENKLYLYTGDGVEKIVPVGVDRATLGEPFIEFALFSFLVEGEQLLEEMEVHFSDVQRLVLMCEGALGKSLSISKQLKDACEKRGIWMRK